MILKRERDEEHYLTVLSSRYKVIPIEKYPDAMIKLYLNQAIKKYVGNKNLKKRMVGRIANYIQEKIKTNYGKYATLSHFSMKKDHIKYHTNFHLIFKVKDKDHNLGYLYGADVEGPCNGILFTEHCLQRFEQRLIPIILENEKDRLKMMRGCEPSTLDILSYLISTEHPEEYGKYGNLFYLNILTGILVLENIEDIYIAKTYLTPDMLNTPVTWYQISDNDNYFMDADTLFSAECEKIDQPFFIENKGFKKFVNIIEKLNNKSIKCLQQLTSESNGELDYSQDIIDLKNNFNKFKQYTFHPDMVDKKKYFSECRELSIRFEKGPIIYFMDAIGIINYFKEFE